MKRVHVNSLFVLFFCITGFVNSGSAQTIKDFLVPPIKKTTWLGLDFQSCVSLAMPARMYGRSRIGILNR